MTSPADILAVVENLPDEKVRKISRRLVQGLSARLKDRTAMWTFKELSNLAEVEPSDPIFIASVQLLASRPRAKLLDMHFLYFDPSDEASIGEPIPDEEVAQAYLTGFLIDPQDGREVHHFERTLVPYFMINDGITAQNESDR